MKEAQIDVGKISDSELRERIENLFNPATFPKKLYVPLFDQDGTSQYASLEIPSRSVLVNLACIFTEPEGEKAK